MGLEPHYSMRDSGVIHDLLARMVPTVLHATMVFIVGCCKLLRYYRSTIAGSLSASSPFSVYLLLGAARESSTMREETAWRGAEQVCMYEGANR